MPTNMFFTLEKYDFPHWISTGIILEGDYRKHVHLLETLRHKCKPFDFRAKRISGPNALVLVTNGMQILTAPEVLKNV